MGMPVPPLTPEAVEALEGYTFPGNVRKLMNIIESALIVSEGVAIQPEHLHFHFPHVEMLPFSRTTSTVSPSPAPSEAMLDEREWIRRALVANGSNITKAARQLGLTR